MDAQTEEVFQPPKTGQYKFATASEESAFATGAFHTATISNCERGSIKNLLGLCNCDARRQGKQQITSTSTLPTSTFAETSTAKPTECLPVITVQLDPSSSVRTIQAGRYKQFRDDNGGTGYKAIETDWITSSDQSTMEGCAAACDAERGCESFSFRLPTNPRGAKCILSKSSSEQLDPTEAFNHYIVHSDCLESTTEASTTATTTTTVGQTYQNIVEGAPQNLVGTTCMPELSQSGDLYTVAKCEAMCKAQYECTGFW